MIVSDAVIKGRMIATTSDRMPYCDTGSIFDVDCIDARFIKTLGYINSGLK